MEVSLFGKKTKEDWMKLRAEIILNHSLPKNWDETVELLDNRIQTRYFTPIDMLLKLDTNTGEGFAVMTLICSLLEFLEATRRGIVYDCRNRDRRATNEVYSKSGEIIEYYLCNRYPFSEKFTKALATDFYQHVRCGLLHEAATKNNWIIKTSSPANQSCSFINTSTLPSKIIYRDIFFNALKEYYKKYKEELLKDTLDSNTGRSLKYNLCRKLDKLCGENYDNKWK